jgi:hypothetical protein
MANKKVYDYEPQEKQPPGDFAPIGADPIK